jgi:hypothetical protein
MRSGKLSDHPVKPAWEVGIFSSPEEPVVPPDSRGLRRISGSGHLDLRSEAEFASALRADTPTQFALVDVAAAGWSNCAACGGVSDEWHLGGR